MQRSAELLVDQPNGYNDESTTNIGQIEQVVSSADCRSAAFFSGPKERNPQQMTPAEAGMQALRNRRSAEHSCQPQCRECRRAYIRAWNAEWARQNPHGTRARWAQFRYGLTKSKYDELVASHGGACGICGKRDRLAIDHDHATSAVRGLLCYRCNRHLAALEDATWITAAKAYLARHRRPIA